MAQDDAARFAALFETHYDAVLGYAFRRTDPDTAQEVAAETFLVAWRRQQDMPDHTLPWLLVVARNILSNHRRSEYRRSAIEAEAAWLTRVNGRAADLSDAVGDRIDVLAALAALSPADRDTLMLVAWDGLTTRDAARVAGCSTATFSVRLHRARNRLTDLLDGAEPAASAGNTATLTLEELS